MNGIAWLMFVIAGLAVDCFSVTMKLCCSAFEGSHGSILSMGGEQAAKSDAATKDALIEKCIAISVWLKLQ